MAYPYLFIRANTGLWNNNPLANPATGLGGGFDISGAGGPFYPGVFLFNLFNGAVVTLNTGGSAFAQTPPAGATNWGGTWDAAHSGGVLSNGNLTLTCGGIASTSAVGTASSGSRTGLLYFETTIVTLGSSSTGSLGVTASVPATTDPNKAAFITITAGGGQIGCVDAGGNFATLSPAPAVGDVIGVALMMTAPPYGAPPPPPPVNVFSRFYARC